MRKIPKIMASQHPDNINPAFWSGKAFIDSREEVKECFLCFSELNCDEYMWDWEGKYVDEAVIERLFEEYTDFFRKNKLGKDVFLTFRLPNIWVEKGSFRILRAFANILCSYDIAKEMGFYAPPLFEVILPLTTSADQMIYLQQKFVEMASFLQANTDKKLGSGYPEIIEIIPLIEDIPNLLNIDQILGHYITIYKKKLERLKKLEYIRPFIARSDPALNYGLISATLAAKIAIFKAHAVGEKNNVKIFPIIGCGSPPFRGHLSPQNIENFFKEYSGVRTITVQSSFRYDHPLPAVKRAIKNSKALIDRFPKIKIKPEEIPLIQEVIDIHSRYYRFTLEELADIINKIAKYVPRRRERRLHIGLFGYSREFKKGISLPRAITFTCSLYSLGLPPEIIGVGRTLKELERKGLLKILKKYYVNFDRDLLKALSYVNLENIEKLERTRNLGISDDIKLIEKILKLPLGPWSTDEKIYKNLSANLLLLLEEDRDIKTVVEDLACIRKFLG